MHNERFEVYFLTALIAAAILISCAEIVFFHRNPALPDSQRFGGAATLVDVSGVSVYDTQSGNLDIGYYSIDSFGVIYAHLDSTITASSTIPDHISEVKDIPKGFVAAHQVGMAYVDKFSDGSIQAGNPTVDDAFAKNTGPAPTKGAAGTTPL